MSKSPKSLLPLPQVRRALLAMLGLSIVASVLLAGLALPVLGSLGLVASLGTASLTELPSEFKPTPPSSRSVLIDTNGNEIAHFYAENRVVVSLKDMSPWLPKAAIATEDRRFYQHHGVDLEGMARALVNNLIGRDVQGASTITQQYVKNTLIDKALRAGDEEGVRKAREQSILRKLREAKDAISVEKKLTKSQIIEGYLNVAPYGRSVYGVESASQYYFGKPAKDLSIAEAALLVGITQSPANYDPSVHPDNAQTRRNQVLYRMLKEKIITSEQYHQAKDLDVKNMLHLSPNKQGCAASGNAAFFCSYVVNEIYNSPQFGKTRLDRQRLLLRGGLRIKTTMNPQMQAAASDTVFKEIPADDASGLSIALASIEPGTGKIRAIAQNTPYGVSNAAGPRATQVNFSADRKHGGTNGYQPGSSFKMITLATFLDAGYSPYSVLGGRYDYNASDWTIDRSKCKNMMPSPWHFQNFDGKGEGPTSVIDGTARSLNSTYAAMAAKLDLCDIRAMATKLGAVSGSDDSKEVYGPAYILGISDVPPLNMANAYATIAANGKHCQPIALESVTDSSGKELKVPPAKCEQVIPEDTAGKTAGVLNQTYYHYGGKANIGRPALVKTGTTNGPNAAWTVGGTPNLTTAVWVGFSQGHIHPLTNITINNNFYKIVWGQTVPMDTWRSYMEAALKDVPVTPLPTAEMGGNTIGTPTYREEPEEEYFDTFSDF